MSPSARPLTLGRFLFQAVTLAGIMLLSLSLYLIVLKWRGPTASVTTVTAWDERIPFLPDWVWIYLVPYLVGPVAVGVLTRDTFLWYIRRGLLLVGLTLLIFIAFPTRTVRPPQTDLGDGPTARLYRSMVAIDEPPANAAPSLHVSLTCLLAWGLVRDFPRWWWIAFTGTGLVWLATLLTWQHHLIDVATGAVLGSAVAWSGPRRAVPGGSEKAPTRPAP